MSMKTTMKTVPMKTTMKKAPMDTTMKTEDRRWIAVITIISVQFKPRWDNIHVCACIGHDIYPGARVSKLNICHHVIIY